MHPAEDIRGIKSHKLSGKRIILGITGSIAAIDSIKLARELIRNGAYVIPVMSKASTKIIHPDSIEYATSEKPIIELSGATEHVKYCGITENNADLFIIFPCTSNTLSKIALGIDDNPVTTFATTAIGSGIPIIIVPAMHLSMFENKIIKKNIKKLTINGISLIQPEIKGNIAKIPSFYDIVEYCIRKIGKLDLKNKNILIIGGPTQEDIDDVRVITNRSSGKTAIALAKSSFERGANVELWFGGKSESVPKYISTNYFKTFNDLSNILKNTNKKYDIILNCAAIADYSPKKFKGKISSKNKKLSIDLFPNPKIIKIIKQKFPKSIIVAFKLESNYNILKQKSQEFLIENDIDFVVGNTISSLNSEISDILILNKSGIINKMKGKKDEIASFILDNINID
jgi:phosphopantothenoylcysteine decarboxylase/phosphopantothenate--cysteine ligase